MVEAKGGILFIDEAERLVNNPNPCGRDVLEEIMALLGDASDVTVIFAGYRKDLVKLYNINEGLERRIHMEIHLDDYKPHELMRIFMDKAENHAGYKFIYNTNRESFQANLQERFNTTFMQKTIPRYNAGLVDHLMNSAAAAIATRAAEDENVDRKLLIEQDVEQAFKQLEKRLQKRKTG